MGLGFRVGLQMGRKHEALQLKPRHETPNQIASRVPCTGFPEYKRQPGRSRESDGKTGAKGEFQYGGSFRGYCLVTIGGSRNGLFRGTTNRRVFVATNVET